MSRLTRPLRQSTLPILLVFCLLALSASYAFADEAPRPLATQVIGDPDAAVTGKFAVGTATPGNKALTVVGVIDFLGAGTVHNYFTQGTGNNMQINTNVDEANTVGDATKSQWKLVLGSSLDWFSIRRSPAGGTYNEDALFFIEGSTGQVGIATVDTGNLGAIPFTPQAQLHVQTASRDAIWGVTTATGGGTYGVYGRSDSADGHGVVGTASATAGATYGVMGTSYSPAGRGVAGYAFGSSGFTYGVYGQSDSTSGYGVYGLGTAARGGAFGVYGQSDSTDGSAVVGNASATTGPTFGVVGLSYSPAGRGVTGFAWAGAGSTYGVYGQSFSPDGSGVRGVATASTGFNYGVYGQSDSTSGYGVYGLGTAARGGAFGVYGQSDSTDGSAVVGNASATTGPTFGVVGLSYSPAGRGVTGFAWAGAGSTYGVYGQSFSPDGRAVYGAASATTGTNYGVYGETSSPSGYGVYFVGGLAGTGVKSAIVDTQDYGWRSLYAVESPQNWFEDFGQATLSGGEVVVSIEEIFSQTVNLEEGYHVFLTPLGDCPLYVAEKSDSSFTVRAHEGADCEIAFDYRIIAPRLDYEDLRLKPAEDPQAVAANIPEVR